MIRSLARTAHGHLTYATVVSALTAFLLLAGGAALAANQLSKSSVGSKQLKKNAVTNAKIKRNAVTNAKLAKNAVTGAKVKDGSLTGTNFKSSGSAYSHIVFSTVGTGSVAVPTDAEAAVSVPLPTSSYTQAAGEDDLYYGGVDVSFAPGCEASREAIVYLLIDSPDPTSPSINDIVAYATLNDFDGSVTTKHVAFGPFEANSARFQPAVDTPHTLVAAAMGDCKSGSGITVSNPSIYVTGVRR